jgi:hypothetical protein
MDKGKVRAHCETWGLHVFITGVRCPGESSGLAAYSTCGDRTRNRLGGTPEPAFPAHLNDGKHGFAAQNA